MKALLGILFVGSLSWNSVSMGACLKDIAMGEVAGNSYSYQYDKADGSSIKINSKTSISVFFSWFLYCTEANMIRAQVGYIRALYPGKSWRIRGQGRLMGIYPTHQYFSEKVIGIGALVGADAL